MKIKLLKYLDALVGKLLVWLLPKPTEGSVKTLNSILIIRPGGIGDAVLLIPIISALKKMYPNLEIDVLAEKRNFGVFNLCPDVNLILCYDRPSEMIQVFQRKYDIVVDAEQWHRLSAIVARLIRSRRKIGFATNERERMFTDVVDYSHDDYEVASFSRLIEPLLGTGGMAYDVPFLQIPETVNPSTRLLKNLSSSYVVLFPGASIEQRQWGAENFRLLAGYLVELGYAVVVVGGPEDVVAGEKIGSDFPTAINMAGKTSLLETASLIKGAELLISGDSGILHIAVGLGVPTVSLFGPGITKKWAPQQEKNIVISHHLSCSPCTKFGYTHKCSIDARCIKEISVDEVFTAVQCLLGPDTN